MSRRRDRERYEAMKRLDPDYRGFRGHGSEPSRPGNAPLEAVTCARCGRKRNVPRGVAVEAGRPLRLRPLPRRAGLARGLSPS